MTIWDLLKEPPARYRTVPLWSWNGELDNDELGRQLEEMHRAGIGGFFMHARGGLKTPYMGEEWMEAVRVCIEKSRELGMEPWLYDENGWPSGFGDGKVPALGLDYRQKRLACEEAPFSGGGETTIAFYGRTEAGYRRLSAEEAGGADLRVYYEVNPYYIDTLSKKAVGAFISAVYDAYWERFGQSHGTAVKGVFTDEPQFARGTLPWSFELEAAFEERSGYDLTEALPALFFETEGCRKIRYDYWACVTALFTEAYAKQIGDWCGSRGWAATGHVVDEQTLMNQTTSVGDPLAFYEYLQIPGCDWLGRFVGDEPLVPKQVGSVARQLGKKQAITESFGCSGWNVSLQDLKRIGEWQFVHGINLMCPHLQGYSLAGLRKRDYPPSLFYQQPWWEDYRLFNDYFARLSMLLAEGVRQAEVLLLHPIRSAWTLQAGTDSSAVRPYHDSFAQLSRWMCQSFLEHDYGSESLIERHGRTEGGRFVIGSASYRVVVVPPAITLSRATAALLQSFVRQGGTLIAFAPYPELIDGERSEAAERLFRHADKPAWSREALLVAVSRAAAPFVRVTDRGGRPLAADTVNVQTLKLDGSYLYYLVHSGEERYDELSVDISLSGELSLVDLESGEMKPLAQEAGADGGARVKLSLLPGQSHMLRLKPKAGSPVSAGSAARSLASADLPGERQETVVPLKGPWKVVHAGLNSLTLDTCRLRVEDGEWSEPQPVILIQERLLRMGRNVKVELEFEFRAAFGEARGSNRELYLVMESPEEYRISLNGREIASESCGWWTDASFRKVDIRGMVRNGRNTVRLRSDFRSSPETREALERAAGFESEGNKLTFDTELESIYLLGDFAVRSETTYSEGERRAAFTDGPFCLAEMPDRVAADDLVRQGLPFFAGRIRLEQSVTLELAAGARARWLFGSPPDAIASRLRVNGREARAFVWEPYEADITEYLRAGENRIELELAGSCRNLLGPHHHVKGEVYKVGPDSFKDKPGWTDRDLEPDTPIYLDRYAFVRFGLTAAPRIVIGEAARE